VANEQEELPAKKKSNSKKQWQISNDDPEEDRGE
jgi:hypothetical protein